jgi:hypothetical protein
MSTGIRNYYRMLREAALESTSKAALENLKPMVVTRQKLEVSSFPNVLIDNIINCSVTIKMGDSRFKFLT